jgi:hypothetical protein
MSIFTSMSMARAITIEKSMPTGSRASPGWSRRAIPSTSVTPNTCLPSDSSTLCLILAKLSGRPGRYIKNHFLIDDPAGIPRNLSSNVEEVSIPLYLSSSVEELSIAQYLRFLLIVMKLLPQKLRFQSLIRIESKLRIFRQQFRQKNETMLTSLTHSQSLVDIYLAQLVFQIGFIVAVTFHRIVT